MKIISGEGNDRLNYGWLAVFKVNVFCSLRAWGIAAGPVCKGSGVALRLGAMLWWQRCAPRLSMGRGGCPAAPSPSGGNRNVSLSSTEVFGDGGACCGAGGAPCGWEAMRGEGCCFPWYLLPALWSSAVTLLFIRLVSVIWFFCISVCLFLYITSSSFLYQIIIIIFEHLCFFCSVWIFAQTYWTP